MRKHIGLPAGLLLLLMLASTARANTVYYVQIQTDALNSTLGWIDLQFNPGPNSWQDAYVDIGAFSTDGSLLNSASPLSPDIFGDVSGGPLPSTLTIHNAGGLNDYFQNLTFGNFIQFTLTFYGPAIDTPNPNVDSGSSFAVALYADDQQTTLLGVSPLAQLDIAVDGVITPANNAPGVVSINTQGFNVPEPSLFLMCGVLLAAIGWKSNGRR